MESKRSELVERLAELMNRASVDIRSYVPEEWPAHEMTMPQYRALFLLNRSPRRMGEIAAHLGSNLSSATSMVERLEKKGLVERSHDPDDRRVVTCHLTHVGRQEIARFWRIGRARIEELVRVLNDEELETLTNAMEVIDSAIERHASLESSQRSK